jgi:hypothetical protein
MNQEELEFPADLFSTIDMAHKEATKSFNEISPEARMLANKRTEENAKKNNLEAKEKSNGVKPKTI